MNEDNVTSLDPGPVGHGIILPTDMVLETAKGLMTKLVVLGVDADDEVVVLGTEGVAETYLLIERAKAWILDQL